MIRDFLTRRARSYSVFIPGMIILFVIIVSMNKSRQTPAINFLALGDSYSIGEGVAFADNFPNQVISLLRKRGVDSHAPRIVAKTGWTTDELIQAIQQAKLQPNFDFVTLLVGVNNQYRGRSVQEYEKQFESLLETAIRLAAGRQQRVIVLSIPDYSVTPFAGNSDIKKISGELDRFNEVNRRISASHRVHYLFITPGTRAAAHDPSLLTQDSLHPSAKEYRRWAEGLVEIIHTALTSPE